MTTDRELCACFTGHRILKRDIDIKELDCHIKFLLENGVRIFYDGMAIGFDTLCFRRLLRFKEEYDDIKIIAAVPCRDQDKNFTQSEKREYRELISLADEVIVLNEEYTRGCMNERNRFMVDRSAYCIAYIYKSMGGSYYTVKYAKENNLKILYVK